MLIIPVLIFLLPGIFMKNALRGMYITGMTASSVEIMLIFIFQIIYGYVYAAIGIIIAIFMGGLALGSLLSRRFDISNYSRSGSQVLLALSILLIPLFWLEINNTGKSLSMILFFILNLLPAVLVGFLYGIYSRFMLKETPQAPILVYSADLLGSALGVVVVTIIVFPLAGITTTCYILAGMNFLVAAINWRKTSI
jgi:spermidine synthase